MFTNLEQFAAVVLHTGIFEVVALLQLMCAGQRWQIVHAPLLEVLFLRQGFENLALEVLPEVARDFFGIVLTKGAIRTKDDLVMKMF